MKRISSPLNIVTAMLAFGSALPMIPAAANTRYPPQAMPMGRYACATSGDAMGPAWQSVAEPRFVIFSASGYRSTHGEGTYLRTGDRLIFTRGPLKGTELRAERRSWRVITDDEVDRPVRCVREGPI